MSQKIVNPSLVKGVINTFKSNYSSINRRVYRETYILYSRPQSLQYQYPTINLCHQSKNHFFGSKKTEEKAQEQTENTNKEGEKAKTEKKDAEAEPEAKPEAKAEAPKATKVPETFDGLIESLPAEHKKRLQALYKKLEEDNTKHAKQIKELNEKVTGLENHNNDQKTKMFALRDRLKEELDERELARVRLEKEVENTKVFAITKFAKDLLEIPDNLERALNVAKDLEGKGDQLYEGVKATRSILLHTLEKHGIKQINPVGEKFDPNQHEALFDYPDPKGKAGHVGHVLTVGYKIQERILRPAKVGVVKDENN